MQVGVYSTIETAKAETDKFRQQRLRNEIIEKEINGKKMFAVIIGNYATKESAEKNREMVVQSELFNALTGEFQSLILLTNLQVSGKQLPESYSSRNLHLTEDQC